MISTQKALRAAFWRAHPRADRRLIPDYSGKGQMHVTDTRVAWCDFIDSLARNGEIPESLGDRATLRPMRAEFEYEIQGKHGELYGFECETTESTRAEALQRLREYRENAPSGIYRIRRRRILVSREG